MTAFLMALSPGLLGAEEVSEDAARFYSAWGLDPTDPQALTDFGTLMVNSGQMEEGRLYYEHALEQDPGFREALYGSAVLDLESGKVVEGVVALRRLSRESDEFAARAHHRLARQSAEEGFSEDAMEHFLRAYEIRPENLEFGLDLGTALLRRQRFEEAEALSGRLAGLYPNSAHVLVIQAQALAGLGQKERAREVLKMALVQDPREPWALFELATEAKERNDGVQAEALFREAISSAVARGEMGLARRARQALRRLAGSQGEG